MAIAEVEDGARPAEAPVFADALANPDRPERDLQRTFRLILATVWLLDAALQLQPFMFTPGPTGFSAMLRGFATGNPGWFQHVVTWNASIINHQPIVTDAVFAGIQFLIAFGIIYKRSCKPALALSISGPSGSGGSVIPPVRCSREGPPRSAADREASFSMLYSPCFSGRARVPTNPSWPLARLASMRRR